MRSIPPLNWLRAFESVARHRSFAKAAKELNVTSSAISQHVKSLENYLDTTLFIRNPKQLQLTDTGKGYLPTISQAFAQLEHATGNIFGQHDAVVRLVCGVAFSSLFIAPRLVEFRRAYPDIPIQLHNNVWWERRNGSQSGLEIRYGDGNWHEPSRLLTNDAVTPMVGRDYPVPAADYHLLRQHPLFQVSGLRHDWHEWLNAANIRPISLLATKPPEQTPVIKPVVYSDSAIPIYLMALQNQGIALLSQCYSDDARRRGMLIQPFETVLPTTESFYLIQPQRLTDAEKCFADWLTEQCRGLSLS